MSNETITSPLTVEELKESLTPEEQTELENPIYLNPLLLYLEGLNNNHDLKEEVQKRHAERIRNLVRQRTSLQQCILKNPDVQNTEINPVVIIGLARTGTTMLHRLLACDPKFVAPMSWELLQPSPPGRPENWRESERYQKARDSFETFIPPGDNDGIEHIHEMKLDLPDECFFILQATMLDVGYNLPPTFKKWKDFSFYPPQKHLKQAYEYYKKALQSIFYKGLDDGKMPLLKSPVHTLYIDMYRATFPNAKFIFPYRNVKEMIASCCSVFNSVPGMTGCDYDKSDIKNYTLEYYKLGSSRVVHAAKEMTKDSLFTISYPKMIRDPMAAIKDLYSQFGWELTPEAAENMQHHMQENNQHKHGAHKYSLEEYRITEEDLRENFSEFLDFFEGDEELI